MFKTFLVNLNISNPITNYIFQLNSGDLNTVRLDFHIQDGLTNVDLTGKIVRLAIRKPDRTTVFQSGGVTNGPGGKCEAILSRQANLVPGRHEAEIMIFQGEDNVAVTTKFYYEVKKSVITNDDVESSNDYPAILQAINAGEVLKNVDILDVIAAGEKADAIQTQITDAKDGYPTLKDKVDAVDLAIAGNVTEINNTLEKTNENAAQLVENEKLIDDISINVKKFGAKGDGVADDTTAIQNALNSLSTGQKIYFPIGTYLVTNITIPNVNFTIDSAPGATIKKISGGSASYMVASYNYLNNVNVVGVPLKINNLTFDGNSLCDDVLILQTWNSVLDKISVRNGLRYGIHYTANTANNTLITSTAVNNRLTNSWVNNNAVHNIHVTDTSRTKVSDMFITNNYIYTGQVGIFLQTSAGTILSGNHLYGHSDYDVQVSISSFAFQLVNNYFEGSTGTPKKVLYIQDFIANTACIFSSNTVAGEVRLYSGNAGSQFLSTGNNYRTVDGCIKNNWNTNVTPISTGDRFETQRPFIAADSNWALSTSSISKFIANGSTTNFNNDIRFYNGVVTATLTQVVVTFGTVAPTAGTFSAGSICYNTAPTAGGKLGWVCVAGGVPGTWKPFGAIDA